MKLVYNIFWLIPYIYNIESNALLTFLANDPYGKGGLTLKGSVSLVESYLTIVRFETNI